MAPTLGSVQTLKTVPLVRIAQEMAAVQTMTVHTMTTAQRTVAVPIIPPASRMGYARMAVFARRTAPESSMEDIIKRAR